MRLIERLVGKKDAAVTETPARSGSDMLPRWSVFGGPPSRILRTASDVKKDDALLGISVVVAEIEKDPNTNWGRYKKDFEKAVTGMREAFEPSLEPKRSSVVIDQSQVGDKIAAPDGGQERTVQEGSLRQDLTNSGWKLSRHDEHALSVYEKHCNENSMTANPHDAGDWLKEFRRLDEEQRVDMVDAQKQADHGYDLDR